MHSVNRSLHSSFTEPRIGQPEVTVGSWSRIIVVAILDYSSFLSESSTAGTFCLKMMLMCHQWISSKIVLRRKETVRWTSLKTHCPQVLKAVHESGRKRLSTWKIGNVKARCMQPPLVSYLVSYRHYIRQPRCRCYEIKWPLFLDCRVEIFWLPVIVFRNKVTPRNWMIPPQWKFKNIMHQCNTICKRHDIKAN